jgi:hypothetical protein
MKVNAFLADSAEAVNGKIYALGMGWNAIFQGTFPFTHPRMALAMTIHVPYTATNQTHRVQVHLEDEDGLRLSLGARPPLPAEAGPVPVDEFDFNFNVGRPPLLPPGDEQVVAVAVTADQLAFPHPGMYTWVIEVDGAELTRLSLRITTPLNS